MMFGHNLWTARKISGDTLAVVDRETSAYSADPARDAPQEEVSGDPVVDTLKSALMRRQKDAISSRQRVAECRRAIAELEQRITEHDADAAIADKDCASLQSALENHQKATA